MKYEQIKNGMIVSLAVGAGICIGNRIGIFRADKTMLKISNIDSVCARKIKGVDYIINVTKKEI